MAKVDGVQLKPEEMEVVLTKPCQYFQSSIEEARREIDNEPKITTYQHRRKSSLKEEKKTLV